MSTARNLGLSYAEGKYVLFVDGDDWLNLDMLRVLAEEAEKSRADMVVCSARIMENEKEVQDGRADWLKKVWLSEVIWCIWRMKRSVGGYRTNREHGHFYGTK